ncbi:hypothetical protein [Nocardioides sp. InS609-2]|uniref:hypothetical protein n=1 Tax=Nocardioides sp. InS609-2 TaxID=2760705 RepID=UPI0020BD6943|nr:hypothetical protein [Nocardioides sp. InS609-2]
MDRSTLAHGIGGAKDLPISPELAIAGAVAALTISFTVLALAWRTPRFDAATSGRPAPRLQALVDAPWFGLATRTFGMLLFVYTLLVAVVGKDLLTNPFFGMFYVLLWVGLIPASLLLGPVWKTISPVRTINAGFARLAGSDAESGMYDYPRRVGYWPAAVSLFAFVWLELVYPYSTELGPVRLWFAAYVAAMLIGGALFGNRFYAYGDPFEVFSTLVSKLSVWGRRRTPGGRGPGLLVVRMPLANLDTVVAAPGLVGVMAVLFGSTAFDSFKDSSRWVRFVQSSSISTSLLNNLALLAFCLAVGAVFAIGTMATGVSKDARRSELPALFAHSIVPIIVGYFFAHYLTYFVEQGQITLIQMSDPLSRGDNLLGTGNWSVNFWLSFHPTFLANSKVVGVVIGHVLGVIAAHDRAVKLLPPRHQLTGQLPLLFTMVGFTVGGLYLLFAA